ncbi:RNA polymerase sigma factor [Engelhardtia mirabilis]|uniref:RNA polymerase sigma factor n=1 Tax=Engelhardtia mirabilis TaxID=2528011 RepID=UPI003AF38159
MIDASTSERSDSWSFLDTLDEARSGKSEALDLLIERFYRRVEADVHQRLSRDVRVGRPWLAARFSTGDIVQEVFRSVIRDLEGFGGRTEDAFCGYLAIVIRNRVVDSIRFHEADCRDGRLGRPMPDDPESLGGGQAFDPEAIAARLDEVRRVERAMAELSPRVRLLVRARIEGQATFEQLAEQLGYGSESSARRAFFDAQARLALRLGAGSKGEES